MIPQKNFNESKKKKKNENHTTDDRREENKVSIENPVPYSVVAFFRKMQIRFDCPFRVPYGKHGS